MKIRILYLITQSELGGAQKYVYYLATHLPKDEYDVAVACGTGGPLIAALREAGIEVYPLPNLTREIDPIRDLSALVDLFRLIRKKRPHLVHANSSKAGILGRLASRLAGVPVVIFTAHGFVLNEPLGFLKKSIFHAIEHIGGILSDLIITVSEKDRQLAISCGIMKPGKVVRIHNGLDLAWRIVNQKSKTDFGFNDNDILVGTVANFYPTKGLPFLIKAVPEIQKVFPQTRVVLVGDGKLKPELERLASKLGVSDSIIFTGQREDVSEILSVLDIFVLPSVKEGLPYALLEAMAARKPVVATAVGGVPEAVVDGETGFLVPAANPEALASSVIKLLQNPELARGMGEAGHRRVLTYFTVERMVMETKDIYRRILKEKGISTFTCLQQSVAQG
jgi:glycosyltransferase involved in cell wall biosynthesis